MLEVRSSVARAFQAALIAAAAFSATGASPLAGDGRNGHRDGNQADPRRGQFDYIRGGLGPGLLPYTRQGHWGLDHRYPKYPLYHAPVPPGPGDCLYETGRFPWQRG